MRLSLVASAAALVALAARPALAANLMQDTYCGNQFCLSVLYEPSTKLANYTYDVALNGAPVGWWGIGAGSNKMAGANMVIGWVNADGNATLSQRASQGNNAPSASNVQAAKFNPGFTSVYGTNITFRWQLPNTPSSNAAQHIFAIGHRQPSSNNAASSQLAMHSAAGSFTLDLTKPYDPNKNKTQTVVTGTAAILILAHLVVAYVTWLFIIPLGVLVARYGRTHINIVGPHRGLQITGIILCIIVLVLGVLAVNAEGITHFSESHYKIGIVVTGIAILQSILGPLGRRLNHAEGGNRRLSFVHIIIGLGLIGVAWYNILEGIEIYDTLEATKRTLRYVAYAAGAIIIVAYVAGLALIPKQRRHEADVKDIKEIQDTAPFQQPKQWNSNESREAFLSMQQMDSAAAAARRKEETSFSSDAHPQAQALRYSNDYPPPDPNRYAHANNDYYYADSIPSPYYAGSPYQYGAGTQYQSGAVDAYHGAPAESYEAGGADAYHHHGGGGDAYYADPYYGGGSQQYHGAAADTYHGATPDASYHGAVSSNYHAR